ncbi:MAG: hypothetical protein ACFFA6_11045 [Promethearchaeota archaeon]
MIQNNNKINLNIENQENNDVFQGICIWREKSECANCSINDKLHCHVQLKYSLYFGVGFLTALIPALLGIFFSRYEINLLFIILIGWFIYALFFFCVWESRVLCSHCPYYANHTQKTLHCDINRGAYKISKFHPEPMKKSEIIQFFIGVGILIGYPIPILIIGKQFLMLILTLIGIGIWITIIQLKTCPVCVNFSCPFNRVPKEIVDEFLKLNPRMKIAWEESGYKIE